MPTSKAGTSSTVYKDVASRHNRFLAIMDSDRCYDINGDADVAGTLYVGGSDGISISSGEGAPSHTAKKGSIYSNVTATTTTTRLYVNTDGGTTWAYLTTSA